MSQAFAAAVRAGRAAHLAGLAEQRPEAGYGPTSPQEVLPTATAAVSS